MAFAWKDRLRYLDRLNQETGVNTEGRQWAWRTLYGSDNIYRLHLRDTRMEKQWSSGSQII